MASCDKPRDLPKVSESKIAPPRITKSTRPPKEDDLTPSAAQLHQSMKQAAAISSPKERDQALGQAIWDCLEQDPSLAQEGFRKLSIGSVERNQLIQYFASLQADESLPQATAWIETLENDQEKSLGYDSIAIAIAETEPEKAAQILSDSGIAGRDFDIAVVQVVQQWANSSPQNACRWVSLFDNGEVRRAGLKAIVATWTRSNPQDAMTWLGTLDNPSIHQEACQGMAETILDLPESRQDEVLKLATPAICASFEKLKGLSKTN
jgi:hypothetical protein